MSLMKENLNAETGKKTVYCLRLFISQSKTHKANTYFLITTTVWEEVSAFSADILFERFITAIETAFNFNTFRT